MGFKVAHIVWEMDPPGIGFGHRKECTHDSRLDEVDESI